MRPYEVNVLVKCTGIYNYLKTVGNGGLQLYVDPLYKQGAHKVTTGIVHALPAHTPDWLRILPELQVGDKVYFHYNALDEDALIPDSDGIFTVLYDMIFCCVRDGKIIPIQGKVLLQAVPEDDVQEIEVNGQNIKVKMSPSGLVTQLNVVDSLHTDGTLHRSYSKGRVTHIGKPLIGETEPDVKVGEIVYYALNADFENEIEGQTYFVMDGELLLLVP
jgi:co-chaperonin GroES (HSP10)